MIKFVGTGYDNEGDYDHYNDSTFPDAENKHDRNIETRKQRKKRERWEELSDHLNYLSNRL